MTEGIKRCEWLLGESLVGARAGMLEVVSQAERPEGSAIKFRGTWWLCRCDCGGEVILPRQYIKQKTITSCGCKKRKKTPEEIIADKARAGRARAEQLKGKCSNFRMPLSLSKEDKRVLSTLLDIRTCPECGKQFEKMSNDWVYKRRNSNGKYRYWCSWKCFRASETKKKPHGNSLAAKALR